MDIGKIIGIGIIAVVLSALLKAQRPEIAVSVPIITVAVIFAIISPYLKAVVTAFMDLTDKIGLNTGYTVIVIKVIGVAYIAQIGSEICRDAGENAIGSKIEIAGKVCILALSMPVVYKLLEVVGEVINLA